MVAKKNLSSSIMLGWIMRNNHAKMGAIQCKGEVAEWLKALPC